MGAMREGSVYCVFCERIARGECMKHDENVVSFEPLNPVVPGHRLFVPVTHLMDAANGPEGAAWAMFHAALWFNEHQEDHYGANIITSIGEPATQTVMHTHVHYVPREPDDGLKLPWTDQKITEAPDGAHLP